MKKILLFLLITALFSSCEKDEPEIKCNETFTVSGRYLNGTTMKGIAGMPAVLIWYNESMYSKDSTIGTATTDAEGNFRISYPCISNGKLRLQLRNATGLYYDEENIPVKQNIERTIYNSTEGSLKIFVNPTRPLEPNDTLLIEITKINKKYEYTNTKSGLLDSLKEPLLLL